MTAMMTAFKGADSLPEERLPDPTHVVQFYTTDRFSAG